MLFLVSGEVTVRHYMRNDKETEIKTRLVEGIDAREAGQKFAEYYNDMTEEYCVYYYASAIDISEVIS
jgi:hypothetical protein